MQIQSLNDLSTAVLVFSETIDTLMMIAAVTPQTAAMENARKTAAAISKAISNIPASPERDRLLAVLRGDTAYDDEVIAQALVTGAALKDIAQDRASRQIAQAQKDFEKIFEGGLLLNEWPHVRRIMRRFVMRPEPETLIINAALVAAVSAFENLLAVVIRTQLTWQPKRLSSGKDFSIGDILEYGSLDSLIAEAVGRRVDALLREDLSAWHIWLKDKGGCRLDLSSLALDWAAFQEVFKRRNAIVHTSGAVNQDYAQTVAGSPAIGTLLQASPEYLRRALEELLTAGSLMAVGTLLFFQKPSEHALMEAWHIAADVAEPAKLQNAQIRIYRYIRNQTASADVRFACGLREWAHRIAEGDNDGVAEEAIRFIESDGPVIQRAVACLVIGQRKQAIDLLREALSAGQISKADVRESTYLTALDITSELWPPKKRSPRT
ncbi:hypothetical protein ACFQZ4_30990 [Catellatospora coxensis]|nr:hypothetical protein [Catellatospora coxensis]